MGLHLDQWVDLYPLARVGDVATLKSRISSGYDVVTDEGFEALCSASVRNHSEFVEVLLKAGVDGTQKDGMAFAMAASKGHNETVQIFLDNNISVHVGNDAPLWHAGDGGHIETAKLLIAHDADPMADRGRKSSPLKHAQDIGKNVDRREIVQLFEATIAYRTIAAPQPTVAKSEPTQHGVRRNVRRRRPADSSDPA